MIRKRLFEVLWGGAMMWAVLALAYFTDGFSQTSDVTALATAAVVGGAPMLLVWAAGYVLEGRRK